MKKLRWIVCLVIITAFVPKAALASEVCGLPEAEDLELAAEAGYLVDVSTGKILFAKNPDQPLFPASTTKIMTALLLLEHAELNEVITVGEEINRIGFDSSTADIAVGDRLTAAEMIYALMLPSGNDAAYTTAVYVARKASGIEQMNIDQAIQVFVDLMNSRARELGAKHTNFAVPDGYHTPGHVSTARDLALITLEAYKHEFLREVAGSPEYYWQGNRWPNTNRLLRRDYPEEYYPWATGFKTGYTPEAGFCVVSTASGGGRELVGVVLNSTRFAVWQDTRALLEYGFNSWTHYAMLVEGRQIFTVPVSGQRRGQPDMVKILAGETYAGLFNVRQIPRLELSFDWARGVLKTGEQGLILNAPIRKGQNLGNAVITLDGEVLAEVEMVAAHAVKGFNWWLPGGGLALLVVVVVLAIRRKRADQTAA